MENRCLALLWARKGGVFRRRLVELRVIPKFLKTLHHSTTTTTNSRSHFFYGERQLSFDKTLIFHLNMHRPASLCFNIPCVTPQVDFDYDFEDQHRLSFLRDREEEEEEMLPEEFGNEFDVPAAADENGIDSRAEEFIAQFYHQMKLQRQISYLQYKDMLNTSPN
ncbi:uncharacterized protein [Euphorbia lathyris]|uniref:uncharacterized protein n=1 Tax=Euphorbia lathyris TaxID=212925 RepID=UPI0033140DDB